MCCVSRIAEDIENLFNNAPSCTMSKSILASDPSVVDVVVHSGAVKSRSEEIIIIIFILSYFTDVCYLLMSQIKLDG